MEADQDLVRSVLQTSIGLVQFPRGLRSQLAQGVAIRDVGKCPKDKIRAHLYSPSSFDRPCAHLSGGKGSACAASVDFLFVRRVCSLAGTIFSSGFIVVQPVTGKIPCVVSERRLRRNSLARNPYAKALVTAMASVSRLCMRLIDLHAALL